MKYRLKKDLPFAKAGAEVKLVNEGKAIEYNGYQCDIYDLREGWIEQIKPREWYELDWSELWNRADEKFSTKEYAEKYVDALKLKNCKIIKVREVLDGD